jgi:hypothetical protein
VLGGGARLPLAAYRRAARLQQDEQEQSADDKGADCVQVDRAGRADERARADQRQVRRQRDHEQRYDMTQPERAPVSSQAVLQHLRPGRMT